MIIAVVGPQWSMVEDRLGEIARNLPGVIKRDRTQIVTSDGTTYKGFSRAERMQGYQFDEVIFVGFSRELENMANSRLRVDKP